MGKVSTLNHFPLEPCHKDYTFLDQAVEDLKHGLYSILKDFINTPELNTSFDEADATLSSITLGFLSSINTHSHTSRLELAPCINSIKLWCQAMALLLSRPGVGRMSTSKLIYHFFLVIQWHLDSRLLCHLITSL